MQWLDYLPWRERFEEVIDEPPVLYTIQWLDALITASWCRFWTDGEAALVTQLVSYPSGALTVQAVIAAGDLRRIIDLAPLAEAWGRENGAIGAEVESRLAWGRALRSSGYAPMQLKLWKDL